MKKHYLQLLVIALIAFANQAMAQKTFDRVDTTSVSGGILQNIRASKMYFGAINAADNGKDQDLLIFEVGSETTAAALTYTGISLYKNNGSGSYTLNSSTFDLLKKGNAAWSKIDGNIVITGLDGNNADAKTTLVYTRDGSGGYIKVASPLFGGGQLAGVNGTVCFIDFDKDGKDDIFLSDASTGNSYLYKNKGSNTFELVANPVDGTANFPLVKDGAVVVGDYNKDTYPDLAIAAKIGTGASDTYTSIYKNNGNGTFSKVSITLDGNPAELTGMGNGSIDFGDLDADGFATDLVVAGNTSGNTSTSARMIKVFKQDAVDPNVYTTVLTLGNGSTGQFTQQGGKRYGQVVFGDLSGSGYRRDFITNGQTGSGYVTTDVFINQGAPTYNFVVYSRYGSANYPVNSSAFSSFIWDYASNSNYRVFAFGDVNGDGKKNDVAKFGIPSNAGGTASVAALYTANGQKITPTLTSPADNASFLVGENVQIKVVAPGSVQKVEFYANNTKIGEATTEPYQLTTNSLTVGINMVSAKVTYTDNSVYDIAPIQVNVTEMLNAEADAYVHGGNQTVNYGTEEKLTVKKDATAYYREAFLRFDLSTITGSALDKAIVRLNETRTNTGVGPTYNWQLYFIADDSWDETTITYSNKPTIGALMDEVPQVKITGGPVAIEWDITSYVNTELAGDKKISMVLIGSANNNTGDADFASRENTDVSLRPQLRWIKTLPVSLISFTAKSTTQGVQLNWQVASETNHKQYVISRSTDGVNFAVIGTTTAHSFLDRTATSGTYYYNLSQEDNDGKSSFLATSVVNIGLGSGVVVYPNPTQGQVTVAVAAGIYQNYEVSGLQGNTVASGTVAAEATQLNLNLSGLAQGTYVIKLSGANGVNTTKVIKL